MFRDQEFTSDLHSRPVKRIADARRLRATQFLEDAGPLAHPVRPDSYVEINNFYTDHGVREGRRGHPHAAHADRRGRLSAGHADLLRAPRRPGGDVRGFRRRDGGGIRAATSPGSAAGTARPARRGSPSAAPTIPRPAPTRSRSRRSTPPTPGPAGQGSRCTIPLAVGLLDPAGEALPLRLDGERAPGGTSRVLEVTEPEQRFVFTGIRERPVPSLLRGFSAPVILESDCDRRRSALPHGARSRPVRALGIRPELCAEADARPDRGAARRARADPRRRARGRVREDAGEQRRRTTPSSPRR